MLVAPPIAITRIPPAPSLRPRRRARVSTAAWSLIPSTRITVRAPAIAARSMFMIPGSCKPADVLTRPADGYQTGTRRRRSFSDQWGERDRGQATETYRRPAGEASAPGNRVHPGRRGGRRLLWRAGLGFFR